MTAQELIALPGHDVGTKVAAEILGCDRYGLNIQAKLGILPFDFFFSGNRLHISKASLLRYMGYNPDGSIREDNAQPATREYVPCGTNMTVPAKGMQRYRR